MIWQRLDSMNGWPTSRLASTPKGTPPSVTAANATARMKKAVSPALTAGLSRSAPTRNTWRWSARAGSMAGTPSMTTLNHRGDSTRVVHPLFQEGDGGSTPTSPLQLHIGRITVSKAIELNRLWHSRLPEFTSPPERCRAFAAECDGTFYASAIWSPPLARMLNHTGRYELRRFAIAPDAPKNTATRMLRVMCALIRRSMPDVATLISYQDTGVHAGTIYKAAGWAPVLASGGGEWSRPSRPQIATQAVTPKVRWERSLTTAQPPQSSNEADYA
jgi:hypothetical protein